jgi:O-antigen ligase
VVRLAVVFAAGLLLAPLLSQQTADERRHVSRWLIAGFALGLMVYFIEYAFDFPIRRLSKGTPVPEVVWLSELNRGAIALALLTWPVTVAAMEWARTRWLLAFPLVMAAVVGLSESLAALAGLATGCAYAAITLLRPRLGRAVILMTLVVGIIGAPLVAQQLSAYGLQDSELVAVNTRHRIHFWGFIAEHIAEKPLLGWGFDSSRNFPNFGFDTFKANEQDVIPLHPHNAALQLWLELGAPGAMLGILLMVIVWRRTARLPFAAHVAACGLFMTTAVGACSAYGLWQNKWMSMMIAAAALMCLYRKQNAL